MRRGIIFTALLLIALSSNVMAEQPLISFKFFHNPILTAAPGNSIDVSATIDPVDKVAYASLLYKTPSDKFYKAVFLKRTSGDTFSGTIPETDVIAPKIMYYITVMDTNGQSHLLFMSQDNPQIIAVGAESAESAAEAAAAEQELALFSSEDIVYSAARHEQKISQAPASVSIITANDIKYSTGYSLSDVFRNVPGMDVGYISEAYPLFNARGYGTQENNLMLVLVNGRVLNNNFYGPAFIESLPIPLADIDRIEVISGASSSLYGADAVTGIISITTKKPQGSPTFTIGGLTGLITEKPAKFMATCDSYVEAQGQTGTTGFISAIGYKTGTDFETPGHNSAFVPKAWLYVDHEYSKDLKVSLEAGWDRPTFLMFTLLQNLWTDAEETYIKPSVEYKSLKIDAYWFQLNVNVPLFITPFGTTINLTSDKLSGTNNIYNLDLQYTLPEIPYNNVIVGLNTVYNTYSFAQLESSYNGVDLTKELLYGGFLHDEIGPLSNFMLTLDGRYDHFSVTPSEFSYRANLAYSITPDQTIRTSYGTAFRKPIYVEAQFIPRAIPGLLPTTGPLIGNPNIRNETIRTTEFGYVGQWGTHVRTDLTVYYQEYVDKINFEYTLNPLSFQFKNSGTRYVSHGGYASIEYAPVKAVKTYANYSYLYREDNLTGTVGNYTTENCSIGARYALTDRLFVNVDGHYVSDRTTNISNPQPLYSNYVVQLPAYIIVNTKVGYTIVPKTFELGAFVFNVFNDIHHEYPYIYQPNNALTQSTVFGGEEIGRMLLVYANLYF